MGSIVRRVLKQASFNVTAIFVFFSFSAFGAEPESTVPAAVIRDLGAVRLSEATIEIAAPRSCWQSAIAGCNLSGPILPEAQLLTQSRSIVELRGGAFVSIEYSLDRNARLIMAAFLGRSQGSVTEADKDEASRVPLRFSVRHLTRVD